MDMTGGQALAWQLAGCGAEHVFGVPGWQLDWALDGLTEPVADGRLRYTIARHEQTAAYMADGYARSTGRVGTFMVGPGPALLNAGAGLADAYACSSPVLCISGQVPSDGIGQGLGLHHEIAEQSALLASLTKQSRLLLDPGEIQAAVRDAFAEAASGRPRPVAVEIPPDVLAAAAADASAQGLEPVAPWRTPVDPARLEEAAAVLRAAERPVIYAGWGVQAADASDELRALAELLQAPVVMSDNGRGGLSDRHPLALTALGGRVALRHADAILVVGSRYLTGPGAVVCHRPGQRLVQLNAAPHDMAGPRRPDVALHGDAREGLRGLHELLHGGPPRSSRAGEVERIRAWCDAQLAHMQPQLDWVRALRAGIPDDGIVVSELTQVAYVAHLAFPVLEPRSFLTSGYAGTLGYGFPTALGVAVGNPGRPVVSLTGDGGFGFNLQELATARANDLDVVVVVFDDGAFGNVRRTQATQFGGRLLGSELTNPDFVVLARSFGVGALRARTPAELTGALREALATPGPMLIHVPVGPMPSPWHLVHDDVPAPRPAPPDPLGDGRAATQAGR